MGDTVQIMPAGLHSEVTNIFVAGVAREEATAGEAVAVSLAHHLDIARGSIISAQETDIRKTAGFNARLAWIDEEPWQPGRSYLLQAGAQSSPAIIDQLRSVLNLTNLTWEQGEALRPNDIAHVRRELSRPIYAEKFRENERGGSFILIDPQSNLTAAAGIIEDLEELDDALLGRDDKVEASQRSDRRGAVVNLPDEFFALNSRAIAQRVVDMLQDEGFTVKLTQQPSELTRSFEG